MIAIIIICGLLVVIGAAPYSLLEQILNIVIDAFEYIINIILMGVTWMANQVGYIAVSVMNTISNWFWGAVGNVLDAPLVVDAVWTPIDFSLVIAPVSFAAMGIDTTFSPIGSVISTWFADPVMANTLGAIGMLGLAALVAYFLLKR